ncbi:ATP-binding protein [Archaeoglobus neptunius]|uniref:ATP-binding protein n=1 Tax=Archaeoglobus neptunius TaxID=2798580 RepID=UPI0019256E7B|nr:ATP-binding protein [Archaeoglobus neptunius]
MKSIDEKYAKEAAKALHDLYVTKLGIGESISEERLFECYPFNPELVEEIFFGRIGMYEEFQRTRGILKIMARVIVNLLRHADELPETTIFISAGEVDLSDPELMRKLADKVFGAKLDQVIQTDIATAEGTAHAQIADRKTRFGNFVRVATAVYLYSLYPDETKKGANSRQIFKVLGDESLNPSTIDAYLEKLYDEIATHIFRAEGTDRYYFKTEENPRALVRYAAKDVKDEEVKLHLQKKLVGKIIPSTDVVSVNIFEKEIKRDSTNPEKLNIFLIDYEEVFRLYASLKRTKEYESESEDVVAGEVYSRIFSSMLSITTPNRNSVVLLFPVAWEIPSFMDDVKELIACEKLKKERAKDKEFLRELKSIQERIYAKTAQKLVNLYSYTGFFQRNDHVVRQLSPITYDEKAKYTERIFEELERKWGKVLSSVSVDYINGVMGMEREHMRVSELISTIANSTSYPFVPAKYLKGSIKELVRDGELALYRGEVCKPEEVDLTKSEEIVRSLKIRSEIQDVRDSDYILKKEFAEELLEAAEKKRADRIAQRILEVLGDSNYAEISYIESAIPDLSRKDIVDAAKRSQRLELYGGKISLVKKLEDGVEVNENETEEIISGFGKDGDFIFKSDYVEEIKKRLISTPAPPSPPPMPEMEKVDVQNLIEKFEELRGKKVKLLRIAGKGSDLKEDSLSVSGAVSFLNLAGRIKVDVRGSVVFRCGAEIEKVGVIAEILKKITELDANPEYSIELETDAEINDDFRIFAEELTSTKSEKQFWVE